MSAITTVEELDALPNGVVLMGDGDAFQKTAGHLLRTGDDQVWGVDDLKAHGFWPMTVLYNPKEARHAA